MVVMCAFCNNKKAYFTQHAQCMLLFLVLTGNFALFCILRSYTLLFQSPVLMHSWCVTYVEPHPVYTICEACILCSVGCLRNTVWPAISIRAHFYLVHIPRSAPLLHFAMQSHTASLLGLLTLVTLLSTASELHRKPPYLCAESKNTAVLIFKF